MATTAAAARVAMRIRQRRCEKNTEKNCPSKKRKSLAFLFPDKHEFPCDHFSSLTSPKLAAVALHY